MARRQHANNGMAASGRPILHVPEDIGVESREMAAKCIAIQIRSFKSHAEMTQPAPPGQADHGQAVGNG